MLLRTIACIIALGMPAISQAQATNDVLTKYFQEVREQRYPAVPAPLTSNNQGSSTLLDVTPYLSDTLGLVRSAAYSVVQTVGLQSSQRAVREQSVGLLVDALADPESGNVGNVLQHLTAFRVDDFTPETKEKLKNAFNTQMPHFGQYLRVVGFVQIHALKDSILPLSKPGNPQKIRWAALLSLARMNDEPSAREVMTRVRKLPINDDIIYEIFPDLVYTRRPEAFQYLVDVLRSDEKLCLSADGEDETPIVCGYRIMEFLAPVITNYPLKADASGDIITKDYKQALKTVRDWFNKNKSYTITHDRY